MKHPTVRGAGKDRILNVRPDAPDLGDRYFEPALIPLKGWGESEYLDLLLDEDDAMHGIISALITNSYGKVVVALKTPYDDGAAYVVLSPMEFIGRLAALVPRPRVNLTRSHGVFSPNSKP